MKDALRQRALELGFDDCRVTGAHEPDHAHAFKDWIARGNHGEMHYLERNAPKRRDPQKVLPGARSVIVVVASYNHHLHSSTAGATSNPARTPAGVIARYARFADYHQLLGDRLRQLTEWLDETGKPAGRSLWYVDTGPILERDLAQRAGVGFVGKHTNLISRRQGNWIFIGEILTAIEIEPDLPEKNRCGSCQRCLAACPTGAIEAPFQLDARRCISYLTIELRGSIPTEFRRAIGRRIYGCDDCLEVCPWNRFAAEGRLMAAHAREDLAAPDLIELLNLDEADFKSRFRGTPILRARRSGLLRNICVALGNARDRRALPALERAAREEEPLIAEHAGWALEEIEQGPDGSERAGLTK